MAFLHRWKNYVSVILAKTHHMPDYSFSTILVKRSLKTIQHLCDGQFPLAPFSDFL